MADQSFGGNPPKSKMSSYDPVRAPQHVGWNSKADLLRCLEIDDQLKLCGLLHGKIGKSCSF
jgi:hypothetical protein